jgi:hypothetical protein
MVLWSAQGMDVQQIAKIAFTSEDRVREVLHNFNDDGFDSMAPGSPGVFRVASEVPFIGSSDLSGI